MRRHMKKYCNEKISRREHANIMKEAKKKWKAAKKEKKDYKKKYNN